VSVRVERARLVELLERARRLAERAREVRGLIEAVREFLEDTVRYGPAAEKSEILSKVGEFKRWLDGQA